MPADGLYWPSLGEEVVETVRSPLVLWIRNVPVGPQLVALLWKVVGTSGGREVEAGLGHHMEEAVFQTVTTERKCSHQL